MHQMSRMTTICVFCLALPVLAAPRRACAQGPFRPVSPGLAAHTTDVGPSATEANVRDAEPTWTRPAAQLPTATGGQEPPEPARLDSSTFLQSQPTTLIEAFANPLRQMQSAGAPARHRPIGNESKRELVVPTVDTSRDEPALSNAPTLSDSPNAPAPSDSSNVPALSNPSNAPTPSDSSNEPASSIDPTTKAAASWQAESLKYEEPLAPEPIDLGATALRLVLGTGAVLATCFGSLWLARRWLPGVASSQRGKGQMRVVDTLSLARRCWIQLVEIEGRQVLIGYDAGGMRTVTPLPPSFVDEFSRETEEAQSETLPDEFRVRPAGRDGFSGVLG